MRITLQLFENENSLVKALITETFKIYGVSIFFLHLLIASKLNGTITKCGEILQIGNSVVINFI